MRRLLFAFVVVIALAVPLRAQDFNATFTLNATNQTGPAAGPLRDVRTQGLISYSLSWSTNGTVSAGACALLGSADNVTFGTTIISAQTVTSNGSTVLTTGNTNFIEVSCTTPITGSGNVQMRVMGWRPTNASVSVGNISGNDAASATGSGVPSSADYVGVSVGGTLTGVTGHGTSMDVNLTNTPAVTISGVATATNQTGGGQKSQIVDGSGNVVGTTSNAMDVNVKSGVSPGVAQNSTTSGQLITPVACASTTSAPTYTDAKTNLLSCDTTGTLRVTGGGVAQGSTTSGQSGNLVQCAATTSAPTYTTAQTNPINCDTSGNVRTNVTNLVSDPANQATATTSPVPAGCVYFSGGNALTNGQGGYIACDTASRQIVAGAGTAGTPAAGVLTVQGATSMTPIGVSAAAAAFAAQSFAVGAIPPSFGTLKSGAVTSAMTGTTSTSVIAGTASNYLYISSCTISNASTTVSTDIILQDGSGGTTLWTFPAPAAAVATTGGGGSTHSFGQVPLKVPTSGNGLFAANVTTGSSTKISCNGTISTVSY